MRAQSEPKYLSWTTFQHHHDNIRHQASGTGGACSFLCRPSSGALLPDVMSATPRESDYVWAISLRWTQSYLKTIENLTISHTIFKTSPSWRKREPLRPGPPLPSMGLSFWVPEARPKIHEKTIGALTKHRCQEREPRNTKVQQNEKAGASQKKVRQQCPQK